LADDFAGDAASELLPPVVGGVGSAGAETDADGVACASACGEKV
jgi:hypothetical protein